EGMGRRVDLNARSEEREASNSDRGHIQNNTVEVEIDPLAQRDVDAVVTEERRLHPYRISTFAKQLLQDSTSLLHISFARCVETLEQITCTGARLNNVWVVRVVQLPGHHFFPFRCHETFLKHAS